MKRQTLLETCYIASSDVITREIENELIMIPIEGVCNSEDDLFTLNATGQEIWRRLDGRRTLRGVVSDLAAEFNFPAKQIEKDVIELVKELLKRSLIIETSGI